MTQPPLPASFRPLLPFPGTLLPAPASLSCSVTGSGTGLHASFLLTGAIGQIALPQPDPVPERLDRLWESTCFELFLAPASGEGYWEFNLAPEHHWNIYYFDNYRKGMRREDRIPALPFRTWRTTGQFGLELEVSLSALLPADIPLQAAVTAVLLPVGGDPRFFALAHTGSEPDFHRRDSFILRL
ncbi:MAG TPA: DOMON-like domain-containing protein [Candidatus Ozemobacteraceae bacterium]|nr:DOMON-like domain-containing protein [Candidatus Ozemobacteraceae bacterium]